jgi:hypothetical protein
MKLLMWVLLLVEYRHQPKLDASGSSLSMLLEVFFLSKVHWILRVDGTETQKG